MSSESSNSSIVNIFPPLLNALHYGVLIYLKNNKSTYLLIFIPSHKTPRQMQMQKLSEDLQNPRPSTLCMTFACFYFPSFSYLRYLKAIDTAKIFKEGLVTWFYA